MPDSTLLLICRNTSVIESVKKTSHTIRNLRVEVCPDVNQAHHQIRRDDVTLIAVHTAAAADNEITQLLWAVSASKRACATLVLCDYHCETQAAALLRAGAADYVGHTQDSHKLHHLLDVLTLRARLASPQLPAAVESLHKEFVQDPFFYVMAPEMVELMEQIQRVAPQDTTLLFTGETGTGKTRLAKFIHHLSPRREEPFLVVDCCALSSNLIESEMFGHVKGAFTGADRERAGKFAAAAKGTLLLDEINSLPPLLQGKLLRAVDERVFEPVGSNKPQPMLSRLIAVTNVLLDQEVSAGRFRSDLFYRLNVVGFYLPPLRDRRAAIVPLTHKFLAEFTARNRPDIRGITSEALRALEDYDWPGNIRELRNVIERTVALAAGPDVQRKDLPEPIRRGGPSSQALVVRPSASLDPQTPVTLSQSKEEAEIRRINEALLKHRNNRLRAAEELGISRMGLYKKLHKYGLIGAGSD
jgi:DNA-binding NtrC family response regulator